MVKSFFGQLTITPICSPKLLEQKHNSTGFVCKLQCYNFALMELTVPISNNMTILPCTKLSEDRGCVEVLLCPAQIP